jgi:hypothetical protein
MYSHLLPGGVRFGLITISLSPPSRILQSISASGSFELPGSRPKRRTVFAFSGSSRREVLNVSRWSRMWERWQLLSNDRKFSVS